MKAIILAAGFCKPASPRPLILQTHFCSCLRLPRTSTPLSGSASTQSDISPATAFPSHSASEQPFSPAPLQIHAKSLFHCCGHLPPAITSLSCRMHRTYVSQHRRTDSKKRPSHCHLLCSSDNNCRYCRYHKCSAVPLHTFGISSSTDSSIPISCSPRFHQRLISATSVRSSCVLISILSRMQSSFPVLFSRIIFHFFLFLFLILFFLIV